MQFKAFSVENQKGVYAVQRTRRMFMQFKEFPLRTRRVFMQFKDFC